MLVERFNTYIKHDMQCREASELSKQMFPEINFFSSHLQAALNFLFSLKLKHFSTEIFQQSRIIQPETQQKTNFRYPRSRPLSIDYIGRCVISCREIKNKQNVEEKFPRTCKQKAE